MIYNRSYTTLTTYFPPHNQIDSIQHQRSSIRRSKVISIKTPTLLFDELSTNIHSQHKIKPNFDRQSPVLIRRHRPTIENLSLYQQPSDINDVFGNQVQLTPPPRSASRSKSPRIPSAHLKPLNYSKTLHENPTKHITFNSKSSSSRPTPIWSPTLTQKEVIHTRILRPRSHSLRHYPHHKVQNEKPHLYISSKSINNDFELFKKTNIKDLVDEWEDPKSNVAVSSDDDGSLVTNCDMPEDFDLPNTTKKTNIYRPSYRITLPPVDEYVNEEFY